MAGLDQVQLHYVDSLDGVLEFKQWLGESRSFLGADIETEGLNVGRDKIRFMTFGDSRHGWAFDYRDWRGLVKETLETYRGPTVWHNALFDLKFLNRDGIHPPQRWQEDTMVMSHLINNIGNHGLKPLSVRHVDKRASLGQSALNDAFKSGGWNWATIPVDLPEYWIYAATDTVLTSMLADVLWPKTQRFRNVYELEMGAINVLVKMGNRGMMIDRPYCQTKFDEFTTQAAVLNAQLPFKAGSDKQLIEFLQQAGAVLLKKTDTGNWAVDNEVLKNCEVIQGIPEAGIVRQYRTATKLAGSYFGNFLEMSVDDILFPNVKPLAARTSRMSVTEPALQQIPRGVVVRDAFIARPGHQLVAADYQQAELRLLAHEANERGMIQAFADGVDIHRWTAAQVFGKPESEVKDEERSIAKNVVFAKSYGSGPVTISLTYGIPMEEAIAFIARYESLFSGVRTFTESVISNVHQTARESHSSYGEVSTWTGRRLYVETDKAYKGVNYRIQCGATSDLLKLKLIELSNAGLGDFLTLPVHDEIIAEVPDDQVEDARALFEEVMPYYGFTVPMTVDSSAVRRWGDKYRDKPASATIPIPDEDVRAAEDSAWG